MSVPDYEVFCDSRLAMFIVLLFELNWVKGLLVWRLSSRSIPGEHVIPCNYHLPHAFPRFWLVTRFPRLSLVICLPAPANRFPCNSLIPCFAALVIVYMISHPRRRELAFCNYLWLQVCSSFWLNHAVFFLFSFLLGSWSFSLCNDWLQFTIDAYSNFLGYRDWPPGPLGVRRADLYPGRWLHCSAGVQCGSKL